jgi:hypothetical protein
MDGMIQKISQMGKKSDVGISSNSNQKDLFLHILDNQKASYSKSLTESIDMINTSIKSEAELSKLICNIDRADIITILSYNP